MQSFAAHHHHIELHAWLNVYPGWRGSKPPEHPEQLYHKHPSWFVVDQFGDPQILNNSYMWLSPTHPGVQQHILNICKELVSGYDIDGIHLDYCRYPGPNYSYDDKSVDLFKSIYKELPQNISFSWRNWRQNAITDLIASIHSMLHAQKPDICLSAAVIGDPQRRKTLFLQETEVWMKRGILDAVYPMLYTQDMRSFNIW
ncbi:MAG: family 10 glycosylhydrolase [candidate division KSB1 bacterium]|nr:family 10 glycosylhydrolase [candidate division KSB1 bacterium]